ncbi:hypothetical protein K0U27_07155 [archaeon]|nr:hypothetical protein [archaeon]
MTGLINQDAGLITENTGLIESSTGMIGEDAGLITKTDDTKYAVNGRRRRSKERGKDSKPRNFPLHTMKNLPQFRNKSHEEFRQHILKTKGVDIGSNISGLQIGIIAVILFVIITSPLWVEKLVNWYDKRKE